MKVITRILQSVLAAVGMYLEIEIIKSGAEIGAVIFWSLACVIVTALLVLLIGVTEDC